MPVSNITLCNLINPHDFQASVPPGRCEPRAFAFECINFPQAGARAEMEFRKLGQYVSGWGARRIGIEKLNSIFTGNPLIRSANPSQQMNPNLDFAGKGARRNGIENVDSIFTGKGVRREWNRNIGFHFYRLVRARNQVTRFFTGLV